MDLGLISLIVTLLLGLLAVINNHRATKNNEKQSAVGQEDIIAKRRKEELDRLYERVDKLEKTVESLLKRDAEKQETIDTQRDELERTNEILSDVRKLFAQFVQRVEFAWDAGHETMPSLTKAERDLLEQTTPGRLRPQT